MKYGRSMLAGVEGYVPGEQPKTSNVVKLNTNENPYPPSPRVREALQALTDDQFRKYPDPLSVDLRTAWAETHGLPNADWVFASNGMDEVLAMAIRTFVDPGQTVLSTDPTYSLYEVLCRLHGANFQTYPLDESYGIPEAMFGARGQLCFITRPNAPTGVSASRDSVERLCQTFPGVVVIDEAYADFADDHCLNFPARFDNVIVSRTFSKSYSLASMRLGIAMAQPALIAEFLKTKDSYNVNLATQAAGLAAVRDVDYMKANVNRVRATRTRLRERLLDLGFNVPQSQANYVLARWSGSPDTRTLFSELRRRNVVVRYFDVPGLQDALRISIGTDDEIDQLLDALNEIIP